MPKDLPPRSTLFDYFDLWTWNGTLDRIHHSLYVKCREAMGREASPTACVIDSQSVKSAENVRPAPSASGFFRLAEQSAKTYPAFPPRRLAKMEIRAS